MFHSDTNISVSARLLYRTKEMRYHLTDIKGILWYHSSATHAAEPLYQRTIVLAVPLLRYEKSDNVNQRYQNTATGGTKSPILSANDAHLVAELPISACYKNIHLIIDWDYLFL